MFFSSLVSLSCGLGGIFFFFLFLYSLPTTSSVMTLLVFFFCSAYFAWDFGRGTANLISGFPFFFSFFPFCTVPIALLSAVSCYHFHTVAEDHRGIVTVCICMTLEPKNTKKSPEVEIYRCLWCWKGEREAQNDGLSKSVTHEGRESVVRFLEGSGSDGDSCYRIIGVPMRGGRKSYMIS